LDRAIGQRSDLSGRHESNVNVTALQAARQARASVLQQMDLDASVAFR